MLALAKGIREPHEVKKKSFDLAGNRTHDLRIRSTVTLPTELRGRTEKVRDDYGGKSRRTIHSATRHNVQHSYVILASRFHTILVIVSMLKDILLKHTTTSTGVIFTFIYV